MGLMVDNANTSFVWGTLTQEKEIVSFKWIPLLIIGEFDNYPVGNKIRNKLQKL